MRDWNLAIGLLSTRRRSMSFLVGPQISQNCHAIAGIELESEGHRVIDKKFLLQRRNLHQKHFQRNRIESLPALHERKILMFA